MDTSVIKDKKTVNEGEDKEAFLLIFVLYKIGSGGLGGGRVGNGMTAYLRKYGGHAVSSSANCLE